MKRIVFFWLALLFCLLCGCGAQTDIPVQLSAPPTISAPDNMPENRVVRLCVTELLGESPVVEQLRQRFEAQTPYKLDISRDPDSVVFSVAQSGGADVLIVREDTASSQFVLAGYTSLELPLVRDSLVFAGPAADPAGVSSALTGQQAMLRIAQSGTGFVSRYDDSDLAGIETRLWNRSGVIIGNGRKWYVPARKAMQGTLELAAEKGMYTLSTREGYLQSTVRDKLGILLQDKPDLYNAYSLLLLDPGAFDGVNSSGADTFAAFLRSAETQQFLSEYGTDSYGDAVFEVLDK